MDNFDMGIVESETNQTRNRDEEKPAHVLPWDRKQRVGDSVIILERRVFQFAIEERTLTGWITALRPDNKVALKWNRSRGVTARYFLDPDRYAANRKPCVEWLNNVPGALVCWGACHNIAEDADKLRTAMDVEVLRMMTELLKDHLASCTARLRS